MQSDFAIAVDRIFDEAIKMIDKLSNGDVCDPSQQHATMLMLFDRADVELGEAPQWKLAKYAQAVWIDEILLTLPWDGASWWRNHILEMELFQTRICNVHFFELAKEASIFPSRDALEVFYNCVVLGFRGMYADAEFLEVNSQHSKWPPTIEQWLERTYRMIEVKNRVSTFAGPQKIIDGAPPLRGKTEIVWWSVAALLLVVANGIALHFYFSAS